MLEKPDIDDKKIVACLRDEFGLSVSRVIFLPLGADRNSAVYRVDADNNKPYFLKLRSGIFDELSVALPKFLSDRGIGHIIAPLTTNAGQLWASLATFKMVLYPYIAGRDGYEKKLTPRQWSDFGRALKSIHSVKLPPELLLLIQQEHYSPQWREMVKAFLNQVKDDSFADTVAAKLADFLKSRRSEIFDLIQRAERHAESLQAQAPQFILCHSDLHPGNILIDAADNLYIIDWDNPIMACKERDLMFIGGGLGFKNEGVEEEKTLFYQGYGRTQINPVALAYYRYERIVQDIAAFCEEILSTDAGGEDRPRSLQYLMSHFLPGGTIATAYTADKTR